MSRTATRLLYLARHGEPEEEDAALTSNGVRQAEHLGRRLARLPVDRITHGPLPRAADTARIVAEQFADSPALAEHEIAGDYIPHLPGHDEVPHAWRDAVWSFLGDVSEDEASAGASLATRAIELLAGPAVDGRPSVDVVITHAFTIGWLVRHALDAPAWRWFPPSQCHAGLTVVRYELGAPPSVVVANDMVHLPAELRWTGFPDHLRL